MVFSNDRALDVKFNPHFSFRVLFNLSTIIRAIEVIFYKNPVYKTVIAIFKCEPRYITLPRKCLCRGDVRPKCLPECKLAVQNFHFTLNRTG